MLELAPITETLPMPIPAAPPVLIAQIADRVEKLREASKSANTRAAYASDWCQFTAWCQFAGVSSLPAAPVSVEGYLSSLTLAKTPHGRDYAASTIARRLASISHFHRLAGMTDPTQAEGVRTVMDGIRRSLATKPTGAKDALLSKHLRRGLRREPRKPSDFRNRALLLIGYAGAFRRSELAGIDVEHLHFDDEGRVRVTLPKSKTNQNGELETIWILPGGELCPVKALRKWLEIAGITEGAVFVGIDRHGNRGARLSTDAICYQTKQAARRAGLDPGTIGAHSLRSGHVTQALLNEVALPTIQQQTRHRDVNTLLKYNRHIEPMRNNSSASLGL